MESPQDYRNGYHVLNLPHGRVTADRFQNGLEFTHLDLHNSSGSLVYLSSARNTIFNCVNAFLPLDLRGKAPSLDSPQPKQSRR
jgi:hypothetical protein